MEGLETLDNCQLKETEPINLVLQNNCSLLYELVRPALSCSHRASQETMKTAIIGILAFSCLFAVACADIWSDCSSPNAHFKIQTVSIVPDPPKIGKNVTVSVSGILDETVTAGHVNFTVQYKKGSTWLNLPTFNFDLCSVEKCPIPQGQTTISGEINVPSITPGGEYRGKMFAIDQNHQELGCVAYDVVLK